MDQKIRNKRFCTLSWYKHKQIINYFRDGDRWDVKIRYSIDENEYKGTGGALLKAYINHLFDGFDYTLIWYGDIIAKIDILDLIDKHRNSGCDVSIVAVRDYQLPVGILEVNDGNVIEVREKPYLDKFVGIGVYLFNNSSMKYLELIDRSDFDISSHYK